MAGETIVFFPKYTTLLGSVGGITYNSDPFDVTGYKTLSAETCFAGAIGSGAISAQMQQSSDLNGWTSFGSPMAPTSGSPLAPETEADPARYVRLAVTINGGSAAAVTFWAKAVARES